MEKSKQEFDLFGQPVDPGDGKKGHNEDHGLSLSEEEWLTIEEAWDDMDAKRAAEAAKAKST